MGGRLRRGGRVDRKRGRELELVTDPGAANRWKALGGEPGGEDEG